MGIFSSFHLPRTYLTILLLVQRCVPQLCELFPLSTQPFTTAPADVVPLTTAVAPCEYRINILLRHFNIDESTARSILLLAADVAVVEASRSIVQDIYLRADEMAPVGSPIFCLRPCAFY